jgi:hypothetical protein
MELESLFGLPAHPLIVHAVVVLLPLAAIGLVVVALVPRARRAYAPVVLAAAIVATVGVSLAEGSGESLEGRVDETHLVEEHTEQADQVLPWAIAVSVVAAAVTGSSVLRSRYPGLSSRAATAALVVAALVSASGATWSVAEVGHSGARATWDGVDQAGERG